MNDGKQLKRKCTSKVDEIPINIVEVVIPYQSVFQTRCVFRAAEAIAFEIQKKLQAYQYTSKFFKDIRACNEHQSRHLPY